MPWIKKEKNKITEVFARAQYGRDDLIHVKDDDADLVAFRAAKATERENENKIQAEINAQARADAITTLKGKGDLPQDYVDTAI